MNPLKRNSFRFRGVPRQTQPDAPSKWQQFVRRFLPWLERKKEQGEQYLQAKIARENADAVKTYAEAQVQFAEAEKVKAETELLRLQAKEMAENAAKKEQELLEQSDPQTNLEEEFEEFADFLKLLYLNYGTRVSIEFVEDGKSKKMKMVTKSGAEIFIELPDSNYNIK